MLCACPKPTPPDPTICDDGYHPCGPDSQECCLDTTSSAFTWFIDTLGVYGSEITDAVVIDENNIWVVGEIYRMVTDTVNGGMWEDIFNVAKWDGIDWEYFQVGHVPMDGIFAFAASDIWIASGCRIIRFDGTHFTELWRCDYEQYGINQVTTIWGTSSDNMYFAGHRGNVVYYDGSTFERYDTGVDTDFWDITGTPDGENIFIAGTPLYRPGEDVVVHASARFQTWERVEYPFESEDSNPAPDIFSCDVFGETVIASTWDGIWTYDYNAGNSDFLDHNNIEYGSRLFRVTSFESPTDIFFGGAKFDYIHYNGARYTYVDQIQGNYSHVVMKGGDYKNGTAVMVGYYGPYSGGLVAIGHR